MSLRLRVYPRAGWGLFVAMTLAIVALPRMWRRCSRNWRERNPYRVRAMEIRPPHKKAEPLRGKLPPVPGAPATPPTPPSYPRKPAKAESDDKPDDPLGSSQSRGRTAKGAGCPRSDEGVETAARTNGKATGTARQAIGRTFQGHGRTTASRSNGIPRPEPARRDLEYAQALAGANNIKMPRVPVTKSWRHCRRTRCCGRSSCNT